jgi:predicted O-methyltransferase YrrM
MRLESLAPERAGRAHLDSLAACGQFDRPVYPVLRQIAECDPAPVLEAVRRFEAQFQELASSDSASAFRFDNDYYPSPDAEVLYAIVRMAEPARIVEIGPGNSTVLFRLAIDDSRFACKLLSVDPSPGREIAAQVDEVFRCKLEELDDASMLGAMRPNDILFVDSSHEIKAGNDVLKLFPTILPSLPPGVIIHVYDVFLPYEYPRRWIVANRWAWTEQYLLQALLQGSGEYDVVRCGHYPQRIRPGLRHGFRQWTGADAQSLWLRKRVRA